MGKQYYRKSALRSNCSAGGLRTFFRPDFHPDSSLGPLNHSPNSICDIALFRRCSVAIASVCISGLLATGAVNAAGLGPIQVLSRLGEPLQVEIPLLSVSAEESANLTANVSSPAAYQNAGLDTLAIRDRIQTRMVDLGTGAARIQISTANGVNETIIPLMIELSWPNGSLQREYMVLLNPAEYVTASSNSASQPAAQFFSASSQDNSSTNVTSSNVAVASAQSPGVVYPVSRSEYVVVKPGDTLSSIVKRILPEGATAYQGMIAVYELNVDSFVEQNIHLVKSGATLTVPGDATVFSYPRESARNRFEQLVQRDIAVIKPAAQSIAPTATSTIDNEAPEPSSDALADVSSDSETSKTDGFSLQILPTNDDFTSSGNEQSGINPVSSVPSQQMQGFVTSLELMSVSLSTLQDENQQLKERLSKLEKKVGLLVQFISVDDLREAGLEGLLIESPAVNDLPVEVASIESGVLQDGEQSPGGSLSQADSATETSLADGGEANEITPLESAASIETDPEQAILQEQLLDGLNNQARLAISGSQESPVILDTTQGVEDVSSTSVVQSTNTDSEANVETTAATPRFSTSAKSNWLSNTFGFAIPDWLLWLAGLLVAGVAWLAFRGIRKPRDAHADRVQPVVNPERGMTQSADQSYLRPTESGGVSYLHPAEEDPTFVSDGDESSLLILEDSIGNFDDGDVTHEGRVDSITESEVYMTYDRPYQAIRVLEDDYEQGGPDQVQIAVALLNVYDQLSGRLNIEDPQAQFISRLHADREQFSTNDWQHLLEKINESQLRQPIQENKDEPAVSRESHGLQYDENGDLVFKQG